MVNGISRSFVQGYLMGLAGLPLKTASGAVLPPAGEKDAPTMFLYNGMGPIPALPEGYDRYPYATITDPGDGAYDLHLSDVPFFAHVWEDGLFSLANYYSNIGIQHVMLRLVGGSIWDAYSPDILGINRVIFGGRTRGWTNYDMPEQYGNIYIRKTAPIPIFGGKENPIAPSVFLAGLRFGILSRHGKALPELPDGVLISSDGYILTDCNGVYLIASSDAEPEQPGSPDVPSGEPIAYLYNGIQMPALPEWDQSTYPFAYIAYKENIGYVFAVSGTERHANDLKTMMVFGNDYTRKLVDGEWVAAGGGTGFSPVWANYDICYANDLDTVILPKSDPIPVYEN